MRWRTSAPAARARATSAAWSFAGCTAAVRSISSPAANASEPISDPRSAAASNRTGCPAVDPLACRLPQRRHLARMMGEEEPTALPPVARDRLVRHEVAHERVRGERLPQHGPTGVAVAAGQRVRSVLELRDDHAAVPGARPAAFVAGFEHDDPPTPSGQAGGGGGAAVAGADHHHVGRRRERRGLRHRRPLGHHAVVPERALAVRGGQRRGHAGHATHGFAAGNPLG